MTTITTTCWGEIYGVRANWAEASSAVQVALNGDWQYDPHGRQVADFQHRPTAALRDWIGSGENIDEEEVADAIADAMKAADFGA